MISLGIDPSWSHTGLACIEWVPVRGLVKVIHTALSAPTVRADVADFFLQCMLKLTPELSETVAIPFDVAGIEAAFVGRNAKSGLHVAESGGFCYYGLRGFNPDVVVHWMQAVEWRRLVFGQAYAGMKTAQAKEHAKRWYSACTGLPEGLSEHEIEAVAIACAACVKEQNKER